MFTKKSHALSAAAFFAFIKARQYRLFYSRMKFVAGIEKDLYCSKNRPYQYLDMTRLKLFIQPRCGMTLKLCSKGKIPDHNNI